MGQQQLLLLVLGIVIVGLAVVVGINAFSENRVKSNADAMVTDGLRIASDVQAWALKPTQFGGGNDGDPNTTDIDNVTFAAIGYPTSGGEYSNVNGSWTLVAASGTATLTGTNDDTGNTVTIAVAGTSSADITTTVAYGS